MSDTSPPASAANRRSADYANPEWKFREETGGKYDYQRFQSSPKARKRHENDLRLLRSFLDTIPPGQKVLDAPSGMGRFVEAIREHGHQVVAIELNFGRVLDTHQRTPSRTPAVQGDVFHLPCHDGAFDVAVCFRLLHHLGPEQVQQTLRELRRVARRAFVTFYSRRTWQYFRQRMEGKTPQRKHYPDNQIAEWCRAAGWKVEQVRPSFGFFDVLHAVWLA